MTSFAYYSTWSLIAQFTSVLTPLILLFHLRLRPPCFLSIILVLMTNFMLIQPHVARKARCSLCFSTFCLAKRSIRPAIMYLRSNCTAFYYLLTANHLSRTMALLFRKSSHLFDLRCAFSIALRAWALFLYLISSLCSILCFSFERYKTLLKSRILSVSLIFWPIWSWTLCYLFFLIVFGKSFSFRVNSSIVSSLKM